eukprot:2978599-Lingulodinium_polyedra.AAC.1
MRRRAAGARAPRIDPLSQPLLVVWSDRVARVVASPAAIFSGGGCDIARVFIDSVVEMGRARGRNTSA